jgi:hypothetical protein
LFLTLCNYAFSKLRQQHGLSVEARRGSIYFFDNKTTDNNSSLRIFNATEDTDLDLCALVTDEDHGGTSHATLSVERRTIPDALDGSPVQGHVVVFEGHLNPFEDQGSKDSAKGWLTRMRSKLSTKDVRTAKAKAVVPIDPEEGVLDLSSIQNRKGQAQATSSAGEAFDPLKASTATSKPERVSTAKAQPGFAAFYLPAQHLKV